MTTVAWDVEDGWIVQTPLSNVAGVVPPSPSKSPVNGVPVPAPKPKVNRGAPVANPPLSVQRWPRTMPGFAAVGRTTWTGTNAPPRITRSSCRRFSVVTAGAPIGPFGPTAPPSENVETSASARGASSMSSIRPSKVVAVVDGPPPTTPKSPPPKPPPLTDSDPMAPAERGGTTNDNGT